MIYDSNVIKRLLEIDGFEPASNGKGATLWFGAIPIYTIHEGSETPEYHVKKNIIELMMGQTVEEYMDDLVSEGVSI
jgi:hypothetical protein